MSGYNKTKTVWSTQPELFAVWSFTTAAAAAKRLLIPGLENYVGQPAAASARLRRKERYVHGAAVPSVPQSGLSLSQKCEQHDGKCEVEKRTFSLKPKVEPKASLCPPGGGGRRGGMVTQSVAGRRKRSQGRDDSSLGMTENLNLPFKIEACEVRVPSL